MNKPQGYNYSADVVRAVAIVCVIVIHVFSEFLTIPNSFGSPTWWFANVVDSFSRISVPLFVMLSGMLLLDDQKTYTVTEFFKKRFSKIGIPIVAWTVFYYWYNLHISKEPLTQHQAVYDFFSLSVYYHLYYLYLIAGLYLLTPILKSYLAHATEVLKKYTLGLAFSFALCATTVRYFSQAGPNFGTVFTIALPYIGYYLIGDYLRNRTLTKKEFWQSAGGYLVLTILTAVLNLWYMQLVGWSTHTNPRNANYDRYFYDYLSITVIPMALLGYPMLLNLSRLYPRVEKGFLAKIILTLSSASFGMYLIHPFFLDVLNRYVFIQGRHLLLPTWLFLIAKVLLVLILSYIFTIIMKKLPIVRRIIG